MVCTCLELLCLPLLSLAGTSNVSVQHKEVVMAARVKHDRRHQYLLPAETNMPSSKMSKSVTASNTGVCKESWYDTFWCLIGVRSRARQESSQCCPNWSVHRTHLLCLGSSGTISILLIQGIHLMI